MQIDESHSVYLEPSHVESGVQCGLKNKVSPNLFIVTDKALVPCNLSYDGFKPLAVVTPVLKCLNL